MWIVRAVLFIAILTGLSACGSKFRTYNGPEVTAIQVQKSARKMYLLHDNTVLKDFDIALGGVPEGHKQFEGDGKTPEGTYFISHKNGRSEFHLSLGISYPNDEDRKFAAAEGKPPGGDIFIHGGPPRRPNRLDWTAGCIAVKDREIEVIYSMVKPGTPIFILP